MAKKPTKKTRSETLKQVALKAAKKAKLKKTAKPVKNTAPKTKPTRKQAVVPKPEPKAKTIFFTGFPGFIGKRLIIKLLEANPDLRFLALVQDKFRETAEKAVEELASVVPVARNNIELLSGDLTLDGLGFDTSLQARLCREVTEIWHLAAVYDLAVPEKIAWQINVEGTRRILELCEQAKHLEQFVYVSTCYVAGLRTGLILEEELDYGQGFKNHYESTKFEAEVLVRQRMSRIPTIIIRPAIVVGDSQTGATDKYDGPYMFARLYADLENRNLLQHFRGVPLPAVGRGDAYFNIVPVDYLVNAMIVITANPKARGKTFQIADPDPCTTRELFDLVGESFGLKPTRGFLPIPLVRVLTKIPALGEFLGFPEQSLDYVDHNAVFDCQNTLDFIKAAGLRCPSPREYIPRMVEYTREHLKQHGMRAKY